VITLPVVLIGLAEGRQQVRGPLRSWVRLSPSMD